VVAKVPPAPKPAIQMKVLSPNDKKDPGPASVMNTYLKSVKLPSITTDIH